MRDSGAGAAKPMTSKAASGRNSAGGVAEAANVERLMDLARRCRELAELTAVPEMVRELERIALAGLVVKRPGDTLKLAHHLGNRRQLRQLATPPRQIHETV